MVVFYPILLAKELEQLGEKNNEKSPRGRRPLRRIPNEFAMGVEYMLEDAEKREYLSANCKNTRKKYNGR